MPHIKSKYLNRIKVVLCLFSTLGIPGKDEQKYTVISFLKFAQLFIRTVRVLN